MEVSVTLGEAPAMLPPVQNPWISKHADVDVVAAAGHAPEHEQVVVMSASQVYQCAT